MNANEQDVIQQINGKFGRWQLRTIILIFLCKIPTAWFMACVIYTAPTPQRGEYYCKNTTLHDLGDNSKIIDHQLETNSLKHMSAVPLGTDVPIAADDDALQGTDREFDVCNVPKELVGKHFTGKYLKNLTQPLGNSIMQYETDTLVPCKHFEHHTDYHSLVTQFDLVCSRQLLVSVSQGCHALGSFIGGILAYHILKYVSPRRLMLYGMLGQIVCGNFCGIVTTFALHLYFRCLTSMFCAFMISAGQFILTDITYGKTRTIVVTLSELFWSIGLILLPGISIFFDSWIYLYVAISSSLVILVFLHRWISDSPRWLLKHNKQDRTLALLLECASFNNCEIPLTIDYQLKEYADILRSEEPSRNFWCIWDGKTSRVFIHLIHWACMVAGCLYNVMIIMIRSLGVEHIHVNTVCLGFAEMLGVFLGLYFILYTRHRWLWTGYLMLFAGFITYFIWFIPSTLTENRKVGLEVIFWIVLKLANSASLSILSTCTGELVSSEKRPMLMLSTSSFSKFWLIFASLISVLIKIHYLIPITIFATLAICNGILMCILDVQFWNDQQPKICKIPTPNTFRRKSSTILLSRRNSSLFDLQSLSDSCQGNDNPLTISITDLWHLNQAYANRQCIEEEEDMEMEKIEESREESI